MLRSTWPTQVFSMKRLGWFMGREAANQRHHLNLTEMTTLWLLMPVRCALITWLRPLMHDCNAHCKVKNTEMHVPIRRSIRRSLIEGLGIFSLRCLISYCKIIFVTSVFMLCKHYPIRNVNQDGGVFSSQMVSTSNIGFFIGSSAEFNGTRAFQCDMSMFSSPIAQVMTTF